MRRHLTYISMAAVLMILAICTVSFATEHKKSDLEQKVAEISSLQTSLSGKISLAVEKTRATDGQDGSAQNGNQTGDRAMAN